MFDADRVPRFVWEIIFEWLSGNNLLQVVLVCDQFREIIENSLRLMKKLEITWSILVDGMTMRKSKRLYSNITIEGISNANLHLMSFLCNQSNHLVNVKFSNCHLTSIDIVRLMSVIQKSIKILTLCNVRLIKENEYRVNFPFPNLNSIHIVSCDDDVSCLNIIKILRHNGIREFLFMSNCNIVDNEFDVLLNFLIGQKHLENLCIGGDSNLAFKLVSSVRFADAAKLNLKVLWLELKEASFSLRKFLMSQKKSLKTLCLIRQEIDGNIMNTLGCLLQLSSLRVDHCLFTAAAYDYSNNPTIKELCLSHIDTTSTVVVNQICYFLRSMHHVVQLNLKSIELTFKIYLTLAYDMKCLIHLQFDKCSIHPFTFVNVRRLDFIDCERDGILQMILVNRHVEQLQLQNKYRNDEELYQAIRQLQLVEAVNYC